MIAVHYLLNVLDINNRKTNVALQFFQFLTLSGLTPWNTSRGLGGQICPPFDYGYRRMFSLFSFSQGSFLGCKGSES